ncbi:UDP-glycosyltransferase 75C1-like [Lycium ferocissimum]|uniref:UDP-glycosyltransferase 75C1-like n=1 Tax=Lycium ferocissimum TaxID=112874 RepID=UPI002815E9C0|nr:UDP-glycosyltransferase 75C1-like [Lycium ferocissimum]
MYIKTTRKFYLNKHQRIMENLTNDCHVLLVTFPGQGHINPSLQFAKRLVNLGVKVTFSTSLSAFNRISKLPNIEGLSFAPFSDGYDGKFKGSMNEFDSFYSSLMSHGSEFVTQIIKSRVAGSSRHIYTTIMAWVGIVAKSINVPSTFFWIQPATVLDIYYYCFTDYADYFKNCSQDQVVELPGLPRLSPRDFPSLVLSDVNSAYGWVVKSIIDQVELLNSEENPRVLVNTFDDLEHDALRALKNLTMVGIGPSIPSAFLDENDPFDKAFGADLIRSSEDYMEWLDKRTKDSVIYIAFGSYSEISSQLMEEIGQGLVKCGRPFLWVIREGQNGENPEENFTCKEELEKHGKIVRWCSQVEVLQHLSLGCFLTHCGWNSTLESLCSGVPVVACPLWTDQGCNAKLVQDVWKTGVRVNANEDGIVERDEFKRCIEIVMEDGEKREELKKNAKKWKDLAKEAMKENGSSNVNLRAYVNEILLNHC